MEVLNDEDTGSIVVHSLDENPSQTGIAEKLGRSFHSDRPDSERSEEPPGASQAAQFDDPRAEDESSESVEMVFRPPLASPLPQAGKKVYNPRPDIIYQRVPTDKPQITTTVRETGYALNSLSVKEKLLNDRKGFIKKVYVLLCLELTWTVIFSGVVVGIPVLREGIKKTTGLVIASCVVCVALVIAILTKKRVAKRVPYNYLAILLFCLFESYIVAFICAFYEPVTVFCAVLVTMTVAASLTVYAWKTKTDFTASRGILIAIAASLVVSGVLMIFFYSHYASLIFCEIVVIIYSLFIVYDTQLIAGGRYDEITFDDYIIASLILFVDIVGLLVYILTLCIDRT